MKYTDLDLDRKRELLVNLRASALAFSMVEAFSRQSLLLKLWQEAHSQVTSLSREEVEVAIEIIERERRGFKQPGNPTFIELKRK